MVKNSDEFENGCIPNPMHCGARVMFSGAAISQYSSFSDSLIADTDYHGCVNRQQCRRV